jgi:hypothetical protein
MIGKRLRFTKKAHGHISGYLWPSTVYIYFFQLAESCLLYFFIIEFIELYYNYMCDTILLFYLLLCTSG